MTGDDDDPRGRRGYHHGNLREALRAAAVRLIAEKGPMGFTIAEAARLAGVSPSAPYRHFADREALLRDVALEGFRRFAEALERAFVDPALTPLQALDAQGRAYLAFARAEPAAYAAMFDAGLDIAAAPDLSAAADRAFAALLRAVLAVLEALPPARRPPPLMVANHVWAMSHGVAALFAHGRGRAPASAEELLETLIGVYLRGLGVLPS